MGLVTWFCSSAYPDVIEKPVTADHEFVLLACDGIWDVLTNQEVVEFVRARIAQRMEPDVVSWRAGTGMTFFGLTCKVGVSGMISVRPAGRVFLCGKN